jgi:hypothetical protein
MIEHRFLHLNEDASDSQSSPKKEPTLMDVLCQHGELKDAISK